MGSPQEKMEPHGLGSHLEKKEPCGIGSYLKKMKPHGLGRHSEKTGQATQLKTAFCTEPAQEDLTCKTNFNSSSAIITCSTVGTAPSAGCSSGCPKAQLSSTPYPEAGECLEE